MKKFLFILLLSAFPVFAHAQTASVVFSDKEGVLVATVTSTKPIPTEPSKRTSYLVVASTSHITEIPKGTSAPIIVSGGTTYGLTTASMFLKNPLEIKEEGLEKNKQYYVRLVEIPSSGARSFVGEEQTITLSGKAIKIPALTFSRDGSTYIISGKVDTSVFTPKELFVSAQILKATGENQYDFQEKNLKSDGTYSFSVDSSSLSELKYQVVVRARSIYGDKGSRTEPVDAKKGTVIPNDPAGVADYEKGRSYNLLAPLPGISKILDNDLCQEAQKTNPDEICDINQFLNFILKFMIGLAAVVLIVRLIIDGYNYMTTDIPFVQAKAKGGFTDALIGLLVALSSYLILNTINPRLVKNDFSIKGVTFDAQTFEGDEESSQKALKYTGGTAGMAGYDFKKAVFPTGVFCPGQKGGTGDISTVAKSFIGKVTYNQDKVTTRKGVTVPPRGNPGPSGTFMLDCSSYATTVLLCAGVQPKYNYAFTGSIFSGKEKILNNNIEVKNGVGYVNNKALKAGDLLGWTKQDGVSKNGGHVMVYIGGGMVIDSHGGDGRDSGKSVTGSTNLENYKTKFHWVNRL